MKTFSRSVQAGQIAQRRDQVECVPQPPEHLCRQRLTGGVQRDQPDRAHGERHKQQADDMQHATPPLLHVKPADPELHDAIGIGCWTLAVGQVFGFFVRSPTHFRTKITSNICLATAW